MNVIKILKAAALSASKLQLEKFKKEIQIYNKTSHQDLVTEVDILSEEIIKKSLISSFKKEGVAQEEIGFLGEEGLDTRGKYIFIIDPIDGTVNYSSGIDYFGISIAYLEDNVLKAGLIYLPIFNTFYIAEAGKGAYKEEYNKKIPLDIRSQNLNKSLISTYFSSNKIMRDKIFSILKNLAEEIKGIRSTGAACSDFAFFTENIIGAAFHGYNKIWDIAAADLIIKEAGGIMVDWSGNETNLDLSDHDKTYSTLVIHPKNLSEFLRISKINKL